MDLVPYMYHEKQEAGSQLCAQHCLNNLLQQFTYTEFDLAEIAQRLDHAENAALSFQNQNKKSYNLDDTGFFSISVLERALQVWDLTLVRWRGEAMKPYQAHPENQAGFILHLSQHWFPLRRFSPDPPHKSAIKRWYNLNSFLSAPEWISPTYLHLFLTQAEKEGYSVFVLRKAGKASAEGLDAAEGEGWGDGGVGTMPECWADRMAVELGEPVGRGGVPGGMGSGPSGAGSSHSATTNVNPDQPNVDTSTTPPSPPAGPSRRPRRQEDLLPTNLSDVDAQSPPRRSAAYQIPRDLLADPDDDDEELDNPAGAAYHPLGAGATAGGSSEPQGGTAIPGAEDYGASDFAFHSRSYDDEDEALQAALRASMEDVPADWVPPDLQPRKSIKPKTKGEEKTISALAPGPVIAAVAKKPPAPAASPGTAHASPSRAGPSAKAEVASPVGSRFKEELGEDDDETQTEVLSPDEIRRRRLARFGQ